VKVSILAQRSSQFALLVTALTLTAFGFLPLFSGLSYEAALVAGLIVPSVVAVATASAVFPAGTLPLRRLAFGMKTGVAHALLALSISVLHGLRVQICDPVAGLTGFILGPGVGSLMAGAWGAVVNLILDRLFIGRGRKVPRWAKSLAFLGPLATALFSVWRFYSSPMVFAYDPFVGYFAGPLYDTVLRSGEPLLWYRVGSGLTLLSITGGFAVLTCGEDGRLRAHLRSRVWQFSLALGAAASSALLVAMGPELGHFSTAASIRETLGRSLTTRRCEVVYSRGVQQNAAQLLGKECDAHVAQVESYFETHGPAQITVFLFASADEKGALMGAAHTFIAKPWRQEIYIQQAGYPHPVLGHELAHVIAGSFGQGPFAVAGAFGGWLPDPGRIEGFAVAASPREDDELTLQEWAQAMQKLELLPALESVFRLGFLGQNATAAYTVAGSFVEWLHGRFGAKKLREWYGGAAPLAVFGSDLRGLEVEWHHSLLKHTVSEQALKTARVRFDQPSIFGRICPHVIDELFDAAGLAINGGDANQAESAYGRILKLDNRNLQARFGLGVCADRRGDSALALKRYSEIANDQALHWAERLSAQEARADILLRGGKLGEARDLYAEIAGAFVDEDRLRLLEVKAAAELGIAQEAMVNLLVGAGERGASWDVAAVQLGQWFEKAPSDGLPAFLLGKNLYHRGYREEAAAYLDQALSREIKLPRVKKEALRVRLFIACAKGDMPRARALYAELLARNDLTSAQRESLSRFATRSGVIP